MKVTVWIRPNKSGEPTIRTDYKYENSDMPKMQTFGLKLIEALESCGKDRIE